MSIKVNMFQLSVKVALESNYSQNVISSKAQKMLNVLYRTCKDINDIRTKKLLYIAWVRSRLEYASVVWSPHTKRSINNLEQVQGRATRFILGRDYSEYEGLSKLNLLPLKYRREIRTLFLFGSVICGTFYLLV